MASDRQQWQRLQEKRERLLKDEAFSALPVLGRTAIICATYSSEGSSVKGFKTEAYELADILLKCGYSPDVILGPTPGDIKTVIQDPKVTSVYTIGDGTLSSLILGPKTNPPNPNNYYSWKHAADDTTHLKLGQAVQRQSGLMQRHLNVPLCLPFMADHRNVLAYIGLDFKPSGLGDSINLHMSPVSTTETISRHRIDNLPRLPLDPWIRQWLQKDDLAAA